MTLPKLSLRSTDGKTVRVEFDVFTFSENEAHDFAFQLVDASGRASNFPDWHQNHVNLRASCPLCVYEAEHTGRSDALTYDEEVMT